MYWKHIQGLVASFVLVVVAGCGAGGGSSGSSTPAVTGTVSLATSSTSIKTDSSDSATITATVVDSGNAAVSGATVAFSTTSGVLSASNVVTGADGKASVTLSSGTADASNRIATVTAVVGSSTATIPIQITGSTLAIDASTLTVTIGGTLTVTATAKDSAGVGRNNQPIRFSIDAASTGAANLSATTVNTGTLGVTAPVTVTTTAPGTVIIVAEWLDGSGMVTQTATKNITVNPAGSAFSVTTPASTPTTMTLGGTQVFTVSVPATINGIAVANVRFSASAGHWVGGSATKVVVPAGGSASDTFTAPGNSGTVTVQFDALSAGNAVLATLIRTVAVNASPGTEATLILQTSAATIAPSRGSQASTATITASVRDGSSNTVANSPVLFELLNTTGSGESISPVVAYTNSSGMATATFVAGSTSTTTPVVIRASIAGGPAQPTTPTCTVGSVCALLNQSVGGTSVSLVIGMSSTIASVDSNTNYLWPASVLVVDNNNNPISGAVVTLSLFPSHYMNGSVGSAKGCPATYTTPLTVAEDSLLIGTSSYRNGILDAGEDANIDLKLNPAQATAGIVPTSVTTAANGVATFDIRFPKTSGMFITFELTARTTVSGSQGSVVMSDVLPISAEDAKIDPCPIAGSRNF